MSKTAVCWIPSKLWKKKLTEGEFCDILNEKRYNCNKAHPIGFLYLHILIYFSFRVNCSLLLEVMDTDKDGKVNEEEMTAWLRKTLRKNYKEDSGQIMSELDTDKDDKLSFEELLKTDEDIGGNCIALEVCNLIVSVCCTNSHLPYRRFFFDAPFK